MNVYHKIANKIIYISSRKGPEKLESRKLGFGHPGTRCAPRSFLREGDTSPLISN